MGNTAFYSVRQMAHALGLPESTVRYYRDTYAPYLQSVGTGRRRLYPSETLDRLRRIRDSYADGMSRVVIEQRLGKPHASHARKDNGATAVVQYDEVLAAILEGERERRDAMWQIAREILRLGETIERQQDTLARLTENMENGNSRAPVNGKSEVFETIEWIPVNEAAPIEDTVEAELENLRMQLERERELVERLRRSKVEVERRAADAEAQLEARTRTEHGPSALRRLLRRDGPIP